MVSTRVLGSDARHRRLLEFGDQQPADSRFQISVEPFGDSRKDFFLHLSNQDSLDNDAGINERVAQALPGEMSVIIAIGEEALDRLQGVASEQLSLDDQEIQTLDIVSNSILSPSRFLAAFIKLVSCDC